MIRIRLIFAVYLLVACASALLYRTSYAVDELQGQLSKLNREIVAEQENIQVLGAEWTYLSEPTRIEQLAAKYLKMEATKPQRVASVRDMNRVVALKGETAAAPVAVAAATPAPVAKPQQARPVQLAAATVQPAKMQAVRTVAYRQAASTTIKTTTPERVKLLLASFQPGRDLTRE